jgi:phage-related protein
MRKPFRLLGGVIQAPPMGITARWEAGNALRRIQEGEQLSMPLSRPMPDIGSGVQELRIQDDEMHCTWRIFYRIDADALVVAEVLQKKTQKTPKATIKLCKQRFGRYDRMRAGEAKSAKKENKL